ncbi:hypothetical protein [Lachnobacterium bovis]|uniref:hypothetical protein n=1 Tax=Lachnobacterium bovis TaxID=140626 RepID=UPI0004875D5D|nr:hypothetical protein [Lachnobacterium bovis]
MTQQRGFGYNSNVFFEAKRNHRYSIQYFSQMPQYIEISQANTDNFIARAQIIVSSKGDVINHNIYGKLITVEVNDESMSNNEFYFECDCDGYIMMHASDAIIVKDLGELKLSENNSEKEASQTKTDDNVEIIQNKSNIDE